MKKQTTLRFSDATRRRLDALAAAYGTVTEAVAVAIDRLYRDLEVTCEICGEKFPIGTPGSLETDTGDVCPSCVRDAEAEEDTWNGARQ
jgi:hypothetical protein